MYAAGVENGLLLIVEVVEAHGKKYFTFLRVWHRIGIYSKSCNSLTVGAGFGIMIFGNHNDIEMNTLTRRVRCGTQQREAPCAESAFTGNI